MPEIITGRAHSGREALLFERIHAAAEQGGAIVIIPDQFSFEMDKQLYDHLGAKLFNNIETAGISALCERICRTYGTDDLAPADDNSKLIAMYKAQSKLRANTSDMLGFYTASLLKPSFVSECIELSAELTRSGADPNMLIAAAETNANGSARLRDIAVIFEAYRKELAVMELRDALSETAYAARLAMDHGFFKGKTVFFDAFSSFSEDELALVSSAVKHANAVTFSIVYSEQTRQSVGSDPFKQTTRTISKLERISAQYNCSVDLIESDGLSQTRPLEHINLSFFDHKPAAVQSEQLVKVVSASDVYEESDYICAEITRLLRDEKSGLKRNDIAVLCGSLEEYSRIFAASAERYDIPYFIDKKTSALGSVPARYLMSILDACTGKSYRTEKILRIVKSPLSFFFYYDALDLEEFCVRWGVEGDMWLSPFKITGEREQSDRIDETRRRIIEPLERFRTAAKDATAGEICEALFVLLDELEMSKQIYSEVKRATKNNAADFEISRGFKQVWLGMVEAIKCIYHEMKDDCISLRSFTELLTLMLDSIKISSPPQKADCLRIGEAERSVMSGVRVLFIMLANDGIFPAEVRRNGLLGENDLEALSEQGAELELSPLLQIDNERMNVYSAITLPSERLYVSYSESDRTGAACAPSSLPITLRAMFEDNIFTTVSDLPLYFFCTSYKTAFYTYLEHSKDKTQQIADIRRSLENDPLYKARLEHLDQAALSTDERLSESVARSVFFPRQDLDLSATRVSDYYKCPFSYFCRHGLKLYEPRSIGINAQYVGNIAHSCLEHVMSKAGGKKRVYDPKFVTRTDDELFELVSKCADEYIEREMGGSYGKTLAFRTALDRLKRSITHMAANFRDELKDSLFIPAAFEYKLTADDNTPILSIPVDEDILINLVGSIDRIDLYRTDKAAWLRVIDYKTGSQFFKPSEVYHGLDLQMLIYLLAVTTGSSDLGEGKPLLPAGIMYSHIKSVKPSLTPDVVEKLEKDGGLDEKLRLERSSVYKPDGVMVGGEVINAMNTDHSGVYTIFKFNADKSMSKNSAQPVTVEEVMAMEQFALERVSDMALRLKEGDIKADPIRTFGTQNREQLPCTYCDYKALCRNADPKEPRTAWEEDKDLFMAEIAKLASEKPTSVDAADTDQ